MEKLIRKKFAIVIGTDPSSKLGGIAFAVPGHMAVYKLIGLDVKYFKTHSSNCVLGKWKPWLESIPSIFFEFYKKSRSGYRLILICHVGGGLPSMLRKFIISLFSRLIGVKVIMQFHGPEVDGYLSSSFYRWLFLFLISPTNYSAVLTPWWRSRFLSGRVNKKIYVVSNSMPEDWERIARLPRKKISDDDFFDIISVARLEPGKGINQLVDAMILLPENYRLSIAGTGSQQLALEQKVTELGLQHRVHFSGWVSGADKQRLLDQADIFCLPSRYDSFGMGYLEAMANGLPVVAYDWGPISDVVADELCGFLAKEYTAEALAACIMKLESIEVREAFSIAAKKWVLEKFSVSAVAANFKSLVDSLED